METGRRALRVGDGGAASQGMPAATRSWERKGSGLSFRASKGNWPCLHLGLSSRNLIFLLLISRTVRAFVLFGAARSILQLQDISTGQGEPGLQSIPFLSPHATCQVRSLMLPGRSQRLWSASPGEAGSLSLENEPELLPCWVLVREASICCLGVP